MSRAVREVARPYTSPAARGPRLPWLRVLVRFFILTVPAQLLGTAIGGAIVSASGLLRSDPQLADLISVMAGLVAGMATGVFITPPPEQRRIYIGLNAGFAVGSLLLLLAIAQLGLAAGGTTTTASAFLVGALLVGAIQTLVAWGLWVARERL